MFFLRTTGSRTMRRWRWRVWHRPCPIWHCSLERRMLTLEPWLDISLLINELKLNGRSFKWGNCVVCIFFSDVCLCPIQSRPFGVALLFGGMDEKGPQLWVNVFSSKHKHVPFRLESFFCVCLWAQVPHGPIRNVCAMWCSGHRFCVWGSSELSTGGVPQGISWVFTS